MYGLVNKAIEEMVCDQYGLATWEQIKQQAELDVDVFLSMDSYPDDVTHRLVKAASEVLQLSAAEIMQAFGEYWVLYTAQEGYGELLDMAGGTLPEFLQNLDQLHARVGLSFPELKPPSFQCSQETETSLRLCYYSSRTGLAPMVKGLVQGLSQRFQRTIQLTQTQHKGHDLDHDEFTIDLRD
jgi:Haem-NO-binding